MPGVLYTLEGLHRKGIGMSVASNKPSDYRKSILAHLQINQFFLDCYGPDAGSAQAGPGNAESIDSFDGFFSGGYPVCWGHGSGRPDGAECRRPCCPDPNRRRFTEELRSAGPDFLLSDFSDILKLFKT